MKSGVHFENIHKCLVNIGSLFNSNELAYILGRRKNEGIIRDKLAFMLQEQVKNVHGNTREIVVIPEWSPLNSKRELNNQPLLENIGDCEKVRAERGNVVNGLTRIDIGVLEETDYKEYQALLHTPIGFKLRGLIELKIAYSDFILENKKDDNIWRYYNGGGILKDLEKMEILHSDFGPFDFYQILVIINPVEKVPLKYTSVINSYTKMNDNLDIYKGDFLQIIKECENLLTKRFKKEELNKKGYNSWFTKTIDIGFAFETRFTLNFYMITNEKDYFPYYK